VSPGLVEEKSEYQQPLAAVTHITDSSFPKSASALPALAPVIPPSLDKRGYSATRELAMADFKMQNPTGGFDAGGASASAKMGDECTGRNEKV